MNHPSKVQIEKAIKSIRSLSQAAHSLASDEFDERVNGAYQHDDRLDRLADVAEKIESAFIQLLTLSEALGLSSIHGTIQSTFANAKREGLCKIESLEDHHGWSYWANVVSQFIEAIDATYGSPERASTAVSAFLMTLLQNLQIAVTDKRCFGPPKNEEELHNRCELVLRCYFPDLMRKPPLAKSVKGYIPDSGVPSLSTLLEYKFHSKAEQTASIADQILADTRGYHASEWGNIVFVIYETERFKTTHEWRSLLRQSGVSSAVQLVLLHGESPRVEAAEE